MTWFVLNYVPGAGFKSRTLPEIIENFSSREKSPIELFAPTFIALTSENGTVKRSEKPLLYHYIFLKGNEEQLKRLCFAHGGFSFVIDHAGAERHMTIDDRTLEQFRIIATYYGNNLPYYPLEGVSLEEGDKVEIVSGPCAGLVGTYISRKGGKSGNILVAVSQSMAVAVYDIKSDYVRVLEFARDSRRAYDQIDAFTLKLLDILKRRKEAEASQPLSQVDVATLSTFTQRLGSVKMENPKLEAKLNLLLYSAYILLSNTKNAEDKLAKYQTLSSKVTNPWTRALACAVFGQLTDGRNLLSEGRELIATLPPTRRSPIQTAIATTLGV